MKKILLLLFLFSGAFALVPSTPTSNYSFSELSLDVDSTGSFTLKGSFNVVPSVNDTKIYVVGPNEALHVFSSSPELYFDENGYFFFSGESGSIEVNGKLVFEQSTVLSFIAPIMWLDIDTSTYSDNFFSITNKQVTIYKYQHKPAEQHIIPTYNIFLEEFGRATFAYLIDVKNPGQEVRMNLNNDETVNSVQGARYKIVGKELVIYPESNNRIRVYGSLPSVNFSFKPGLGVPGYVVVQYPSGFEVFTSGASHVDESKVNGVEYRYNNKVCFESYPSSVISITAIELDSFPSLVFAVDDVGNTVSISENGVIIQNTEFRFSNTGVEYTSFDVNDLEPLYASINGQATFLTKKDDKIYLAVPKGTSQRADLITLDKKQELFPATMIDLEVPRIDHTISSFSSTVYYPNNYEVMYSSHGTRFGWEGFIFVILIFTGFLYIVVPGNGKARFLTAILLSLGIHLLTMVSGLFFLFALVGYAYALYKKYKNSIKFEKNTRNIIIAAVIGLIVIGAVFGTIILLASTFFTRYSAPAQMNSYAEGGIARAPLEKTMSAGDWAVPSDEIGLVTEKEILPVKLSLPRYSNSLRMTHYMVTKDKPLQVQMLLVHTWLVKIAYAIIGLILLGFAWKRVRS
ncbi:hypothetical protein K8R43_00940 [archaeon]|nr:hypothetical protein [archaeon]